MDFVPTESLLGDSVLPGGQQHASGSSGLPAPACGRQGRQAAEEGVEAEDGVGGLNFPHRAKRSTRCSLSNHLTEQFRSRLWDDYLVGK
jgi:hypothetical protein